MSTFNLTKNSTFDLTKAIPSLNKIKIVLSWTTPNKVTPPIDADLSLFGLKVVDSKPKLYSNEYFIYYNQLETTNKSIVKDHDERVGGVETAYININSLPSDLDEISVVVTLYEGSEHGQRFNLTSDMQLEVFNDETNESIFFVDLDNDFPNNTAAQIGSFFKQNNQFTFKAINQGYDLSLGDFITGYTT